ncbi:MAG TPA: hypothetical protein PK954_19970, partial [Anaerolineales bacterium]|nr:hypothetical protein [Anaerolineales bacterium]
GALDSKTGADIMALFRRLHDEFEQTVIIVTHDPGIASQTNRTLRIADGIIVGDDWHVNGLSPDSVGEIASH